MTPFASFSTLLCVIFALGCSSSDDRAANSGTGGTGGINGSGGKHAGGSGGSQSVDGGGTPSSDADCGSPNDAGAACNPIAPDTTLADRQAKALTRVASSFKPLRVYDGNCGLFGNDGWGLVARLELGRRNLPGGATATEAGAWIEHIAKNELAYVGKNGVQGSCPFTKGGSPAPAQAEAALAYAIVRYNDASWPSSVKESVRALVEDGAWDEPSLFYLANDWIDQTAADLLVGEALARPALFARGASHLAQMFDRVMADGAPEANSPLYTAQHFPALAFLSELKDEKTHNQARILLDYELTLEAHLYLPGGAFGAPRSREYGGGLAGLDHSLRGVAWLLTGDPANTVEIDKLYGSVVIAATDYVLPEVIRSIFLDKGAGYTFWAYTDAHQGSARSPNAVYKLGLDKAQGSPWESVVLPGGKAATGVAYGWALQALAVNSATHILGPDGDYSIIYQYQPWVGGDTDETLDVLGSGSGGSGVNNLPDDFLSELYDYERMVYGRTAVSLWDPTLELHAAGAVRKYPYTVVHLPNFGAIGGEATTAGKWRVGRLGDVYVAYLPLGTIETEDATRDGGKWTFLRLAGASGGVTELATTAEFPTLADYAKDLESRSVTFSTDPLAVELDARDPATGKKARVRLEYRPERRVIDGAEQSVETALGHGLMQSPFVSWDEAKRTLTVSRECYSSSVYDWQNIEIQ